MNENTFKSLHKIAGIDKHTCTAEQMIAYNYASMHRTSKVSAPNVAMSALNNAKLSKYNTKYIAHLLTMHLDSFRRTADYIADNYQRVAELFPLT